MIVQSWDTAIKASAHHDASACATFRYEAGVHYLIDMQCIRLDYPKLKRFIYQHACRYTPESVLIEDKASGQSLLQDLRLECPDLPLIPIMPKGDKVMRIARISSMVEAGKVALPYCADWLGAFEAELQAFPNGVHDDQVDAFGQYLWWFKQQHARQTLQMRRV